MVDQRHIATPDAPTFVRFGASDVRDGDLLLFRSSGLIARAGRSRYSHAAVAAHLGPVTLCVESREWVGGRLTPLAAQVRRRPGRIDVYRVDKPAYPSFVAPFAARRAAELAGADYAYWSILYLSLYRLPIVWRFLPIPADDPPLCADDAARPRPRALFCSELVSRAYHAAGIDPVPNLPHHLTEPADLARSAVFQYCYTLKP